MDSVRTAKEEVSSIIITGLPFMHLLKYAVFLSK